MAEYIYEIEDYEIDESEIFIGYIRRHSPELIRCKDCKHSENWYGDRRLCFLLCETGASVFDRDYCSKAEKKTE